MAPFGTGYRVASSSCGASLGGGSFVDGSSFDWNNVLEYAAGRTGSARATAGANCSGSINGTALFT